MQGWILVALAAWGQSGEVPLTAPAPPAYAASPAPAKGAYQPGDLRQSLERLRDTNEWPGRSHAPASQSNEPLRTTALPPVAAPTAGGYSAPRTSDGPRIHPNYPVQLATYAESSSATVSDDGTADTAPRPLPSTAARPLTDPETPAANPLAAPLPHRESLPLPSPGSRKESGSGSRPAPSTSSSIVTVLASLAIVLGLFFVAVWFLRRAAGPGPAQLPSDAVAILGQVPLSPRQNIHLLRVANKLLVVCSNGDTAATLTEIEAEDEVERIASLCAAAQPGSATSAFRDILGQLGSEPTAPGFLASGNNSKSPFAGLGLGDDD